jgi:hypothetical protein
MSLPDLLGLSIGFLLTIAVFSYILGDNPLFRLAIYLFVGVAAGYVAVMTLYSVLIPQLILPLIIGSMPERLLRLFPLALAGLLLFKASPRLSPLGTIPVAYLVGVGAAVAVGGAVLGTVFTQVGGTIASFDFGNGLLMLIGTLSVLLYFQFGYRKPLPDETSPLRNALAVVGAIGQVFIAVALGAFFAGVYASALTALIERVHALWSFLHAFIPAL